MIPMMKNCGTIYSGVKYKTWSGLKKTVLGKLPVESLMDWIITGTCGVNLIILGGTLMFYQFLMTQIDAGNNHLVSPYNRTFYWGVNEYTLDVLIMVDEGMFVVELLS